MFQNLLSKVGLGGLPSNFGYTVGDKVELEYQSLWQLHTGQKRADGTPVSVFVCPKKDISPSALAAAKNAEQVSKSLRHPNVLRALDSCEVESGLYLVTEAVTPLLRNTSSSETDADDDYDVAVWGLHQALDALNFLHSSGFTHGLFGPASIFVTPRGDYRLAGFEMCSKNADIGNLLAGRRQFGHGSYGWPEPPKALNDGGAPTQAIDFWGATVLISYLYTCARTRRRGPDVKPDLDRAPQDVPAELRRQYAELQKFGPLRGKTPVSDFIGSQYFQQHPAVRVMSFLGSLHIRSSEEKESFFEGLPALIGELPRSTQTRQVLPELLEAQKFPGQEAAQVLPSILKIGVTLKEEEFREKVAPLVVQLFVSPDRAVRFRLLVSLGDMIDHLDEAMINDKIFPECVNGFSDSNAPIREATVKSLIHFVPRLRQKTVEQRVAKLLPKVLQDPEASIRTNSVICCGRIAQQLPQPLACQLLMQAFQGGLKDAFSPCRSASLHTLAATAQMFSAEDMACRLLPLVCQRFVDPDASVSNAAFEVAANLQQHLKQLVEEQRVAQQAAAGSVAADERGTSGHNDMNAEQQGRWGSWMSSVGSAMGQKIMGSMGPAKSSNSDPNLSSMAQGASTPVSSSASTATAQATMTAAAKPISRPVSSSTGGLASSAKETVNPTAWDEDDFWEEFGDLPPAPAAPSVDTPAPAPARAQTVVPARGNGAKPSAGSAAKAAAKVPVAPKAAPEPSPVVSAGAGWSTQEEEDFWKEFDA
eukprot:TRINITY_DN4504_c0_g1_i1.p1 TRINITY_DN4504_c0_g1~~TRINITY_DN4504_c0_g1_i1.p1  ORF type:complete len:761 (+),score=93.75 TRINITY_DN4504_c0_g1_i1:116-2398(+)